MMDQYMTLNSILRHSTCSLLYSYFLTSSRQQDLCLTGFASDKGNELLAMNWDVREPAHP